MATINVQMLDEDVVRDLKSRAARNNRSLAGEVRHILERVVRDDMSAKRDAFLNRAASLRRKTEGLVRVPSEDLIREDRDRGH